MAAENMEFTVRTVSVGVVRVLGQIFICNFIQRAVLIPSSFIPIYSLDGGFRRFDLALSVCSFDFKERQQAYDELRRGIRQTYLPQSAVYPTLTMISAGSWIFGIGLSSTATSFGPLKMTAFMVVLDIWTLTLAISVLFLIFQVSR